MYIWECVARLSCHGRTFSRWGGRTPLPRLARSGKKVGNLKLHTGMAVKCKVTWCDGSSICSKTREPHVTLPGFTNGGSEGHCETNKACPYPFELCEYIAWYVTGPEVNYHKKLGEHPGMVAMVAGPPFRWANNLLSTTPFTHERIQDARSAWAARCSGSTAETNTKLDT